MEHIFVFNFFANVHISSLEILLESVFCGLGIETVHSGINLFLLMMSWKLPEKTALTKSGSIIGISSLARLTAVKNDMNNCRFIGHHHSKERILKSLQMVTQYSTSIMATVRSLDSWHGSLLQTFLSQPPVPK